MPFSDSEYSILRSVSKALDVLQAFTKTSPEMSLGELAQKLGMGKSTIHKLLHTLLVRGFVTQDRETRRYRLGLSNWELGVLAVESFDIREVTRPHLRRLGEITGEQLTLWVYESGWAVCIDHIDSRHKMRPVTRTGTVEKPTVIASGRCMLAFSADAGVNRIVSGTEKGSGKKAHDALLKTLHKIRDRGYDTNMGETWEEIRAIAAPIFNHTGVVGAISVAGLASRFDEDAMELVLPHLLDTVSRISQEMGFISASENIKQVERGQGG